MNIKFPPLMFTVWVMCMPAFAQTGFPKYYECLAFIQKGDSLYKNKQYHKAALAYLQATKVEVERGIEMPKNEFFYSAACSFSLAHKVKEALENLQTLTQTYHYRDLDRLLADTDFAYLQKEASSQWQNIIAQVSLNKQNHERRQATIKKRTTLPVETNEVLFYPLTSFAKQYIEQDSLPFLSIVHQNFKVYFSADSYAATRLPEIKQELTEAYHRAITLLGEKHYKRAIHVVLFNSVEEMKQITGIRAQGGIAYPAHDIAFFPYHTKRRPQFKHELFHVIANIAWGYTYSRLLNEGSAVYADNQCYIDNPIYGINAYLLKQNKTLPMKSLVENFDAKAKENDVIAYLQSAGIFKYLYEKYGIEKMKLLWVKGFEHFKDIYGLTVEDFETEWLHYIKSVPVPDNIDEHKLLKEGCG